jgi:cytochrome c
MRAVLKKQTAMFWGALVCLMAFTAASCTSSEVSSGPSEPVATTMAQAANPCAAKNPCATVVPIDPTLVTRPAGITLFAAAPAQLLKEGERLWNNRFLGSSGLACQTCHLNHANFNPSFVKAYPHPVAMPHQRAGLQQVTLDEMVQFCLVVPMARKPLAWESKELAALTAYAGQVQKGFIKAAAANPCMLKPAAANPCNPCAAKNPGAMKTVNPCAAKNPCAGRQ